MTVDGITVGAQPPLFDKDPHDTMQIVDPCRPPRSAAGRQADMSSSSIPQPKACLVSRGGVNLQ